VLCSWSAAFEGNFLAALAVYLCLGAPTLQTSQRGSRGLLLLDAPVAAAASRPTPAVVVPQMRQPEQQRRLPDFEVDSCETPAAAPQPAAAHSRLVGSRPEIALRPAAGPMAGHTSRNNKSHRDADLPAEYYFVTERSRGGRCSRCMLARPGHFLCKHAAAG